MTEPATPGMTARQAAELVALLESRSAFVWVGGGWGVDALVGRQTRPHRDLDVAVAAEAVDAVLELVGQRGFAVTEDWLPVRVEVAHPDGRRIDLHPVRLTADGAGVQAGLDGTLFRYPAGCTTTGSLAGRTVTCLTAAQQLAFREGYEWRPADHHDAALLRAVQPDVP